MEVKIAKRPGIQATVVCNCGQAHEVYILQHKRLLWLTTEVKVRGRK